MELWNRFDRIVVFDTETTGIDFEKNRIIELGAVSLENGVERDCMDALIRLPEGETLPPEIVSLTGITDVQLLAEGVSQQAAVQDFCRLFDGAEKPLIVAYNAQFDLNFMSGYLKSSELSGDLRKRLLEVLKTSRFLDALTVYKDRRDYPHKLCNAIDAYRLGDRVVNSHRAVDDARAAVALMEAMAAERDDLCRYLDLFGHHPKYGISGRKIGSVTYRPQGYQRIQPLYQWGGAAVK